MARSNMTRNDWLRFGTVIVVAVVALYLLYPFWPLNKVVKLGLDLQGGVRLVLEAEGVADMTPADQTKTIDQVITILSNRIDQYGLANAEIRRFGGERILINLPGAADPEEARRLIGQTALLEFRRVIQAGSSPLDDLVPTSIDQEVLYDRDGRPYIVEIAKIMRQMNVNDLLAIVLDNMIYSAPRITESIKEAAQQGWRAVQDSTTITGRFDTNEAKILAIALRAGALPTAVTVVEEESVGPTLGNDSIRRGMMTIVIGFIVILIYMMVLYRVLGAVANLALVLNMLIIFGALVLFRAVLTLPGIAGIILTIGMTVDANVIIFERVKEERRQGNAP